MASLEKLAIRGIRSFDDKHIAVIEFFTPVTVIVGHNGSGKTTIIECLKYCTTGDLPPNTKGGAFVHDPKMANEKEVKAQVKLRFKNTNGEKINVTRNLSVTLKKGAGGLTMKTLEVILANADKAMGNKRATISTKCAEVDTEVPRLLGVSKAVLENVIFCHQEESNWPLSEPSALKKKFDDIFEATKYTDALDQIKKVRKDRAADLKTDKVRLENAKKEKERADGIQKAINKLEVQISSKETEASMLTKELNHLTEANHEFYNNSLKFTEILNNVNALTSKKQYAVENVKRIENATKIVNTPLEELKKQFADFEKTLIESVNQKRAKEDERLDKLSALEQSQKKNERLMLEKGQVAAELNSHNQAKADRENLVFDVVRTQNWVEFDKPLTEDKLLDFASKLREDERKHKAEKDRKRRIYNEANAEITAELTKLSNDKASHVANRDSVNSQLKETNTSIRRLELDLENESYVTMDADLQSTQQELMDCNKTKTKHTAELEAASFEEQIKEKRREISVLEADRERLTGELAYLNRQGRTRTLLDMKQQELVTNRDKLASLINMHQTAHKAHVGKEINNRTVEDDVARAIERTEEDRDSAANVLKRNERSYQEDNLKLNEFSRCRNELNSDKTKLQEKIKAGLEEAQVEQISPIRDTLDDAIAEWEDVLAEKTKDLSHEDDRIRVFTSILDHAKIHEKCNGCGRHIDADEWDTVMKFMENSIRPSEKSNNVSELVADIDYCNSILKMLRDLSSEEKVMNSRSTKMEQEIAQMGQMEAKVENGKEQVAQSKERLLDLDQIVRDLYILKGGASKIKELALEIPSIEKEISNLQDELSTGGSANTIDGIQKEIDDVSDKVKTTERKILGITREKDLKHNSIQTVEKTIHSLELKVANFQNQLVKKQEKEKQLTALRATLENLKSRIAKHQEAIDTSEGPISQIQDAKTNKDGKFQDDISKLDGQIEEAERRANKLSAANREVERYISTNGPGRYASCQKNLEDCKENSMSLQREIVALENEIKKLERLSTDADRTKTNLSNNILHRKCTEEIESIQKEIDSQNLAEADTARRQFQTKYNASAKKEQEMKANASTLTGIIATLKAQLKEKKHELSHEYKNIQEDFKRLLIAVKTSELANLDLEKYGKALDNAIMKYHSLKMAEVNETIGHFWRKTYQGTDIDGILIRSDADEAKAGATRRLYNYRVVMMKDQVELDMRGRCSAGQKVLASIIIRLALAESFGENCGMIALDEPTTNLDRENIKSLAESLSELIALRKEETSNFQLVVITHDEDFLNILSQSDCMDYYWRVDRDGKQKSTITRQRVGSQN